jgi:hypothetical protein
MEPMAGEDKKCTYRRLSLEILAVMVTNISNDMPKLKFFNLLEQRNSQGLKMNFLVMQ